MRKKDLLYAYNLGATAKFNGWDEVLCPYRDCKEEPYWKAGFNGVKFEDVVPRKKKGS